MPNYRNYNPNTKYGRRKMRDQAHSNYVNGTPEHRQDIDEIGCVVWGIIIGVAVIIFFFVAYFNSPEAAVNWLK